MISRAEVLELIDAFIVRHDECCFDLHECHTEALYLKQKISELGE
jgi:hypothetical protein